MTPKCIFSKLCKKNINFFYPPFLKGFYDKMFTFKMVFPAINQRWHFVLIVLHFSCEIPIRLRPNRCVSMPAIPSTPGQ